jgi:methionyl-tRNA formyltransferase
LQTSFSVSLRDDSGSVRRLVAFAVAIGIDQVLTGLADGTVRWKPQEGTPTYAAKLGAEDSQLSLAKGSRSVHDQVRSLSPNIGAWAASDGLRFKVWRTWPYGGDGLEPVPAMAALVADRPGQLVVTGERLFAGCRKGAIELLAVQPVGKRTMTTAEFLRGYGTRLGGRLEQSDLRPSGGEVSSPCSKDLNSRGSNAYS